MNGSCRRKNDLCWSRSHSVSAWACVNWLEKGFPKPALIFPCEDKKASSLSPARARARGSVLNPTFAAFIVCGPFSGHRSFQIRFAAFSKYGTGLALKCLGWPCCFLRHQSWHCLLAPRNTCLVTRVSGHFAIYVRWLLGWRYISSLHSADDSQEGRNSCPLLRFCFISSCHVYCLKSGRGGG